MEDHPSQDGFSGTSVGNDTCLLLRSLLNVLRIIQNI